MPTDTDYAEFIDSAPTAEQRLQAALACIDWLAEYAERYADLNDEDADGDCSKACARARAMLTAENFKA